MKLRWCTTHEAPWQFKNEIYDWCLRYNSNHETEDECSFVDAELVLFGTQVRWCVTHDQFVAGDNSHCGCEFSEGCAFDNTHDRFETEWVCEIVTRFMRTLIDV